MAEILIATVKSFTSDKRYDIRRDTDSGALNCSCPAWVYSSVQARTCKHILAWQAEEHAREAIADAEALALLGEAVSSLGVDEGGRSDGDEDESV